MTVQSLFLELHVLCDSLYYCIWPGIGVSKIAFFFFPPANVEDAYKKKWEYLCRTIWMLGFPVGVSIRGSFFPLGRSRERIDSYSAHPLPFLSLLCATSGSTISIQLHYQHPPPYHLIAATSGATQFHSFVSLPLVLVMSGPRATGRDSPGKNIIQCQTLFFLAQLRGAGERTMCLFSPHPQTSSAFPFSSPLE